MLLLRGHLHKEINNMFYQPSGILSISSVKTNPMQPVAVTVVITSDSSLPDVNQVTLLYYDKNGQVSSGSPSEQQKGQYLILTYLMASHLAGSDVTGSFPVISGGQTRILLASLVPEYYSKYLR